MYSGRPNLTIGFHGCDESIRNQLVRNPNAVKKARRISIGWAMVFMFGKIILIGL